MVGMVGLIAKPLSGALDAASSITGGVARFAASSSDPMSPRRAREPRMVCC